jgi:20S proteasome alpha/beta subunit
MVISLDGAVNDKYSNFLPTAATAAILERFYRRQSSGEVALDAFVEAVKVYSDVKFRRKAEGLKREIAVLPAGDLKQKKTDEYNALVKNILSEELKIQELQ